MKAVCLALALATSAQEPAPVLNERATPAPPSRMQLQAREIYTNDGIASRGVSIFLPKDADGYRYYYSRATKGKPGTKNYSTSTIESWSDPSGRPLRAHYEMKASGFYLETDLTIEKDKIVFDEILFKQGAKPSKVRVAVPVAPGTTLQLSQFHPMDIPLGENGVTEFTLVDPIAKRADLVRLSHVSEGQSNLHGKASEPVHRYRIEGPENWTEIELDVDGRFRRMMDSSGTIMRADTPLPDEKAELRKVYNRARQRPEDVGEN